ncbi:hypothetical protein [Aeromonas bestiarum]|uniref:LysR family transcriptional regulator n=1 Tax=Aeromonas bestiarum TaxID=105751 RepID=A0ABT7Q1C6_9GAMM|nr:hypothetical protein [Aeromonas bestiarum]MDM5073114.1 hypothetical protein [Aeromonas bestiarum]
MRGPRCLSLTPAAERLLPFIEEGLARMGEGVSALIAVSASYDGVRILASALRCPLKATAPLAGLLSCWWPLA